jgi:AAA family ATP:ADP antiporter
VPLYGSLSARLPRRRLINLVTTFFVVCLAAFFALVQLGVDVGVPFFLWVGIFNVMVVAQFWSFANDVYTTGEGERLFPIVAFGGSLGAVLGSAAAGRVIAALDVAPTLLLAAGLLALGALVTNLVDTREVARSEHGRLARSTVASGEFRRPLALSPTPPEPEKGKGAAFRLVFGNPYLLGIACIVLLLNWVNTNGEYILSKTVERAAAAAVADGAAGAASAGQVIGGFYAAFYTGVNALGLGLQLFVVSRVLKHAGVRAAVMILPLISLGAYALLAFYPLLAAVRWAKTAENATDYSLNNTVRNVLFLPTTREQKYAAKQAVDSFFKVSGDMLSAGLVFAGTTWLGFGPQRFALVNLALVAAWLVIAAGVGGRYRRLAAQAV